MNIQELISKIKERLSGQPTEAEYQETLIEYLSTKNLHDKSITKEQAQELLSGLTQQLSDVDHLVKPWIKKYFSEQDLTMTDDDPESPKTPGSVPSLEVVLQNDSEIAKLYHAFQAALILKHPQLAVDTNVLTITRGMDGLSISPVSSSALSSVHPLAAERSTLSPLASEHAGAMKAWREAPAFVEISADDVSAIEKNFMTDYDDSSDGEDDGYPLDSKKLSTHLNEQLEKYKLEKEKIKPKKIIAKIKGASVVGKVEKADKKKEESKIDSDKVSFMLFVLGMMLLRSNQVKPYYRYLKEKYLLLNAKEFEVFKNSVALIFQEKYGVDQTVFQRYIWPKLLTLFRHHAKAKRAANTEILSAALIDILEIVRGFGVAINLSDVKDLVKAIQLPSRRTEYSLTVSFTASFRIVDLQLFAMTLMQYRLVNRMFKNQQQGVVTISSGIGDSLCTATITLSSKDHSRRDYLTSRKLSYLAMLTSEASNQSSIKKCVQKGKTHQQIARDIRTVVEGHGLEQRYRSFLRDFYYILMQNEVSRNPATIMINVIMFRLIEAGQALFSDFLPNNEDQRSIDNAEYPRFFHPMTLEGAPKTAVGLTRFFNPILPAGLQYQYDSKDDVRENTAKFSTLQANIVRGWFASRNPAINIDTTEESVLVKELCDLAVASFNPKKQ